MIKIGSLSNTIRTVLMVTVLTPSPLLAEPAATARQMLFQAQTRAQDHAVKSEVKKITERGPIRTETPAVTSFPSNLQEPSAIPTVIASATEAKIEPPSQPSALRDDSISVPQASIVDPQLASRAPAYQVASVAPSEMPQGQVEASFNVTSPTPANAAQATAPVAATIAVATTSQDIPAVVPPAVMQPTTIKIALEKNETQDSTSLARTETKGETGHNVARRATSEAAVRPVLKKTTASTRIANSSQVTHQRYARANSAVEFADSDIRPQLQRILNRPEVRSLMAQYGLN